MEEVAVAWGAGGVLAAAAYIVGVAWPSYREHAPTAVVLVEVFHFGPRVALMFVLWPLVLVALVGTCLEKRGRI